MSAGEGDSPVPGKVVPGSYAGKAGKAAKPGKAEPPAIEEPDATTHDEPDPLEDGDQEPALSRPLRAYARLLGVDVD
jgi:hypothetical protein